jgi:hypothetical protein
VREQAIYKPATASRLMPISSDAKALEGFNVHFGVLDEIASHRSKAVYDVIITGVNKACSRSSSRSRRRPTTSPVSGNKFGITAKRSSRGSRTIRVQGLPRALVLQMISSSGSGSSSNGSEPPGVGARRRV